MRKTFRGYGRVLALVLILHAVSACTRADATRKRFDIESQPAGTALNEFARQADITLIFSYDTVAGARTQALQGKYTVDAGLDRLLAGTGLDYRQIGDAFLVCPPASCAPVEGASAKQPHKKQIQTSDGGKHRRPRLNDKPVTVPGAATYPGEGTE